MSSATFLSDYEAIRAVIQHYIDGAVRGKGDLMKPAFHAGATIYGYVGPDLFGGEIDKLYAWNDANGPDKDLQATIAAIDIVGTVASARVESDNWTGHRFTDFFNLLKVEGQWQIVSKVFHLHTAS